MTKYYVKGAIVTSIAGRDKGELYIVFDRQGDYVYLVNGKTRPIDNPKKKNTKHLNLVCKSESDINRLTNMEAIIYLKNCNKSLKV